MMETGFESRCLHMSPHSVGHKTNETEQEWGYDWLGANCLCQVKNILFCGHRILEMFAYWWQAVSSERNRVAHCKAIPMTWKTAHGSMSASSAISPRGPEFSSLLSLPNFAPVRSGPTETLGEAGTGALASGESLPIAQSCEREKGWGWALFSETLRENDTGIRFWSIRKN